jgi:hypothetical protein
LRLFAAACVLGISLAVATVLHQHVFVKWPTPRCPSGNVVVVATVYGMADNQAHCVPKAVAAKKPHNKGGSDAVDEYIQNLDALDYPQAKPKTYAKRYRTSWQDPLALVVAFAGIGAAVGIGVPARRSLTTDVRSPGE